MQAVPSTIIAQADLFGDALGVVVSIVVSFVCITLVASYYRFQHIVRQAEEKSPQDMGVSGHEILRVQLARCLADCARRGVSFSLALINTGDRALQLRLESEFIAAIRRFARRDDIVCLYDQDSVALLAVSEPEDAERMLTRITRSAAACCDEVQLERMRVGIASYPGHGLAGKELIETAARALEETSMERPVLLPEIIDPDEEVEDQEDDGQEEASVEEAMPVDEDGVEEEDEGSEQPRKSWKDRRKESILDPVTGVLKPSAISSHMQRLLSELRYKKQKAALFCIGVNNMEHIERFHGEDAADDVLAGVSEVLQHHLRADDLIGRHEKHAFMALVRCSLEQAEAIGKRVSTLVQQAEFNSEGKKLKTTITLGVAACPEHGRNMHQLYQAGQKVLDYSRANDIRAYAVYDPKIHDKVPSKPIRSIKSVQA